MSTVKNSEYSENKKLKVFEAFAGVGSQRMALRNLGISHEVVAIAEIDKYAIKSYEAIHGKETVNLGDISQIETEDIPDHDLFTYSFPCQDISVAGKQCGLDMGSGTRSGLLWECQKVISVKKPKYLLLENVKNLVGKRHRENFDKWLEWLDSEGYSNYWKVLNAKDFGIPQNRERVFVVSILGEHEPFEFPDKQELQLRLKDMLEDTVDEKFYLNTEKAMQLINIITTENEVVDTVTCDATIKNPKIKDVSNCITARYDAGIQNKQSIGMSVIEAEPKVSRLFGIFDTDKRTRQARAVYDKEGVCPTLDTMQGGWRQPSVLIKNATKKGYLEATVGDGIDLAYPSSNTRRCRVQKGMSQTLQTSDSIGTVTEIESEVDFRIRKLTPLECWRLMGFTDTDFYKAQAVNSNTQLYKQAGNSIVVDVLEGIFSSLFLKQGGGSNNEL